MSLARVEGAANATALAEPHHDGSELYVVDRPDEIGGTAVVRLRAPHGAAANVWLRYVADGEPRTAEAVVDEDSGGETWWRAELPVPNPTVRYRWLVDGGNAGYRWLNGIGMHAHEVAGADDFMLALDPGAPPWHARSVAYEIFPDRFATSGAAAGAHRPEWAVQRDWDRLPEGRSRNTSRELLRRRPARRRAAPRPRRGARREPSVSHAVLPRAQHPPLRRLELRPGRPAARRRRGAPLAPRARPTAAACTSSAT